ncbi:MAG: type II toxin-antitoxin system HicA family toxin [Pseudomonadota bacterium]
MPKVDKRLQRFLSVPNDLAWAELVAILNSLGFAELAQRRGSYRTFVSGAGLKLFLHRPHPGNIVKRYAIREVIEALRNFGIISEE